MVKESRINRGEKTDAVKEVKRVVRIVACGGSRSLPTPLGDRRDGMSMCVYVKMHSEKIMTDKVAINTLLNIYCSCNEALLIR